MQCHASNFATATPAALAPSLKHTRERQPKTAGTQLVCPECGKRFLREGILREHRRTRHLVHLPTPEEEASAAVQEDIRHLQARMRDVQERIRALKARRSDATAGSSGGSTAGDSGDDNPYPAATAHGRLLVDVSDSVLRDWATRRPDKAIGTGISTWVGVGTVVKGTVQLGTLEGFTSSPSAAGSAPPPSSAPAAPPPRVLQFQLETFGYRERRPGQLKMFRNHITVRKLFPTHAESDAASPSDPLPCLFTVREGDLLRVMGNYAQHRTFDAVSKSFVENAVVEAETIGLLERGPAKTSIGAAHVAREEDRASGGEADVSDVASVEAGRPLAPSGTTTADPALRSAAPMAVPKTLTVRKVKRRTTKRRITGK